MSIEKIVEIDEYVQKLLDLEVINSNLSLSGHGKLEWVTYFDGDLYTIKIYHINEL